MPLRYLQLATCWPVAGELMKTCSHLGIITLKDRILPLIEQPNSCEVESGRCSRGEAGEGTCFFALAWHG